MGAVANTEIVLVRKGQPIMVWDGKAWTEDVTKAAPHSLPDVWAIAGEGWPSLPPGACRIVVRPFGASDLFGPRCAMFAVDPVEVVNDQGDADRALNVFELKIRLTGELITHGDRGSVLAKIAKDVQAAIEKIEGGTPSA